MAEPDIEMSFVEGGRGVLGLVVLQQKHYNIIESQP